MQFALVLAALGLLAGPFLGIAVDRVVDREKPKLTHRCQRCQATLPTAALVPIRSWFLRCPTNPSHPRWRYPLTDISTAAMFFVAGWRFGLTWQLWPYLALFAVLVVLLVTDLEHHLLIDDLTLPALGLGSLGVLLLSTPNGFADGMWPAFAGAGFLGFFFLASHLIYPDGMGLGDVKLAPTLGLFVGWMTNDVLNSLRLSLWAMITGLLLGGVIGLAYRTWARRQPEERFAHHPEDWIPGEVPLGPFLVAGAVIVIGATAPAALA